MTTLILENQNRPFIIDLESTNGTHVNGEQIPESRYYELKLSDSKLTDTSIPSSDLGGNKLNADGDPLLSLCIVIKFGESNREYVLLSEDAA